MFIRLNYSQNFNGKLLSDYFSDIRLKDDKFIIGNHFNPHFKDKELGVVQLVALRQFKFKQLNDSLSYSVCGKGAHYMAKLLKNYYSGYELTAETVFQHLVLHYTHRQLEYHQQLLKDWWRTKCESQPNSSQSIYDL